MADDKLTILIADDEPLATERLQILLSRRDGLDLVGTASDGEAAVRMAEALKPQVMLLDIAMPGMDGIEVARALSKQEPSPAVIFVTAFDQFAVAAFEVAAVDYLMKPIDPERLGEALERARTHLAHLAQDKAAPAAETSAEEARQESEYIEEFWASDRTGLVRIAAKDIDRISAERDYMRLHVGARSWLIHHSMTALEEELDPGEFVRLHRSAIVRRDFISGFARNSSGRWIAKLADGNEQSVGRLYNDRVKEIAGR